MRVLVVEDEPAVQDFITSLLKRIDSSVEVEAVPDGDVALTRYLRCGPYDLVITDHAHSGLSGIELIDAIRLKNEAQAIILQTGNTGAHIEVFRNRNRDVPILEKPYKVQNFLDLVRAATPGWELSLRYRVNE